MPQKIIIDADPGIGDALAITLALADANLDVLAVTATAGCVSGADAGRNVQALIERLDPPKWPRIGCCLRREVPPVDSPLTTMLNGRSGLGNLEFRVAELHHRHESAKLICDLVRENPHEVLLLTMGPLSNVEFMYERAPDIPDLLRGIVILGGAVTSAGDVTPTAEFNMYGNPDAARGALRLRATKTLVPLDVSERVMVSFDEFDRIPNNSSRVSSLLRELLPFWFRAHHQHLGLEGIGIREVVALAAVARPELFRIEPMAVDVETSGELTRGMTVFDRRGTNQWPSNIDVLTDVDADGVLDYLNTTLAATF